ncbi:cytochrome c oxidase accessory protein CcoG [Crateriforma conspicua]|uniref:cytochrome c oxidase accessory protein CcoG n=1 Tax=Crateriforma conspicua TaxID=2527996 RepID=UPI00119FAFB2|nr:cytochrome c oxidase accessory protein CcoG [Crateriforma conspicua]
MNAPSPMLEAPEHVLSTLEGDGSRRWLRPKLAKGHWWRRRQILAYVLIVVFVALPHLRINGRPLILLDIPARKFVLAGHTFLPTDTVLLALLLVSILITIVLLTALTGRVWCGWGCPQTVYMEYVFRPIDRFFEGTLGRGGKPKRKVTGIRAVLRFLVYLVLCMALAHTFLAYFVGTERLAEWMRSSPFQHPIAFVVMFGTTGLMLFDFLFFREQMCLIACPYGRFQSVMLDRHSLIVAYDETRGEPRKKGKRDVSLPIAERSAGDCVDCNQCVVVCPTGIDIRDGLQMECINCTQCIDACDDVMDRVGLPKGLIRYSSQDAMAGNPLRFLRMRTVLYPAALIAVLSIFFVVLSTKFAFDARLIRSAGNPFQRGANGQIVNNFRLRLWNRSEENQDYKFQIVRPDGALLVQQENSGASLEPGQTELIPLTIQVPPSKFGAAGQCDGEIEITDGAGNQRTVTTKLLGPR